VQPVLQELQQLQAQPVLQVHKVQAEQVQALVQVEYQVLLVNPLLQDQVAHQVQMEQLEQRVHQEFQLQQAPQALQELKVQQA
jgi:hypothetical protein